MLKSRARDTGLAAIGRPVPNALTCTVHTCTSTDAEPASPDVHDAHLGREVLQLVAVQMLREHICRVEVAIDLPDLQWLRMISWIMK
jgi:hypothetical protein